MPFLPWKRQVYSLNNSICDLLAVKKTEEESMPPNSTVINHRRNVTSNHDEGNILFILLQLMNTKIISIVIMISEINIRHIHLNSNK